MCRRTAGSASLLAVIATATLFACAVRAQDKPANVRDPNWWSLQPVRRPAVPTVSDHAWARNPIDRFILAKLRATGVQPAAEADRRTLVRRVTFDLTGLPPTPEELEAALRDPSDHWYEKVVDRLLASPAYGERWARHWLDIVRFAESHGYETNNLRPNAWPYRDYVVRAFNQDTPYPQFIVEQLAGDSLPNADWLTQAATGLLVGGAHDVVGNQTVEGQLQQRMDDLDDIVTTVGATFLGLTTNCARCHDHKFDPISTRDYYSLQAVFAGVQHNERSIPAPDAERRRRQSERIAEQLAQLDRRLDELEPEARSDSAGGPRRAPVQIRRNVDRFAPVDARFVRFTVLATNNKIEPCIDELEIWTAGSSPRNVALANTGAKATASSVYPNSTIHRLEHLNDGQYGNGRSWISSEPGKGWVQIEFPAVERIDRVVWGRDREEKFQDRLAVDYRVEIAVAAGQWRVVASSEDRQPFGTKMVVGTTAGERASVLTKREELQKKLTSLNPAIPIYSGTFTQPETTHVLLRGDPMRKGDAAPPSGLAAVRPALRLDPKAPERERRLALARWLGNPNNPLPARVMVNRLWQHHFGQGIVATPSDLGFNGDRPSHPELLDWLASELMANGWRLKPLHRLMVLSTTYRQSGRVSDKALSVDKQNRLLWRMSPRRLEAEAVRDAMLAVSGTLDRRMAGPGYNLWEKNTNYVVVFTPKTDLGREEFRRMIYQFKPRTQQDPTFGVFDCPDAALARPQRASSTTALQALNLFNGRFALQQVEFLAERLKRESGDDPTKQVGRAFLLLLGREPTAIELAAAVATVRERGIAACCRAMYNANEFLCVD
jgi:hypothetical protein